MSQGLLIDVAADPLAAARRRVWSRHQHSTIHDPTDNERYTLAPTVAECMRLAGVSHIDIDCAGCPEAHVAPQWLGRQLDGSFLDAFLESWRPTFAEAGGVLVGWLNPEYVDLYQWFERAWLAMVDRELDVLLALPPGDRCEQPWWQDLVEPMRDGRRPTGLHGFPADVSLTTHNLKGRQTFGCPTDPHGTAASCAPFPSLLIVFRHEPKEPTP